MAGGHVWQGACVAYGQLVVGTHPTGMHSCLIFFFAGQKSFLWDTECHFW